MGLAGSHTEKTLWKVVRMRRKRATAVCTLPGKTPHLGRRALGSASAARARGQLRQWGLHYDSDETAGIGCLGAIAGGTSSAP